MGEKLTKGGYVLATKYSDGDPFDGWAVGFYDGPYQYSPDRHMVVDGNGMQFRRNGFRRVERITAELGEWICLNALRIDARTQVSPINIWRYKYGGDSARKELDETDLDEAIARILSYYHPPGRAALQEYLSHE